MNVLLGIGGEERPKKTATVGASAPHANTAAPAGGDVQARGAAAFAAHLGEHALSLFSVLVSLFSPSFFIFPSSDACNGGRAQSRDAGSPCQAA